MKKHLFPLIIAACAFALVAPPVSYAEEKAPAAAKTEKAKTLPFNGKVVSVDPKGESFVLSGPKARTMHVTDKTEIKHGEEAGTIADLKAGEEVRGSASKDGDTWTAHTLAIGAKAKAEKK